MINNISFLVYEIWFYLLLIASIKIVLSFYISWVFPYTAKRLKYVVDRGILWELEVALDQQKSAQTCTNGSVVLAEGLDMIRLRPIANGGGINPSDILSFTKIIFVGWMPGSWTQRDVTALAEACARIYNIKEFSPYLKQNIELRHYKDQLVNAV
jgi:hypothetical protein